MKVTSLIIFTNMDWQMKYFPLFAKNIGQVVHPYAWKAQSDYQETSAAGGYYAVCVDNQFSRFAAKLINLYITTFR